MSQLFTPTKIGPLTLSNRIVIAPMCQYSAEHGKTTDWHTIHLGHMALSGAGLLIIEATAVEDIGRITHGCVGLYSDETEAALKKTIDAVRQYASMPIMIQLAHAGRKGSSARPWEGGQLIAQKDGGWQPVGPSAIPQLPTETPHWRWTKPVWSAFAKRLSSPPNAQSASVLMALSCMARTAISCTSFCHPSPINARTSTVAHWPIVCASRSKYSTQCVPSLLNQSAWASASQPRIGPRVAGHRRKASSFATS